MSDKLSIIIPVYNASQYLEQCVQSILSQNICNMEVILVNDCSLDDSGQLCDKLAENEPRIRVIHKPKNEGVGSARNTGLAHVTGDYIAFVDSDDWLEPNSLRPMMDYMLSENLDLIQAKKVLAYEKRSVRSKDSGRFKILTREEAADAFLNLREISATLWDKIYKAQVFSKIRFSDARSGEDAEIMHLLIWQCDKIGFLDKSFYHYRQREGSLTHQTVSIALADFSIRVCKNRIAFFEEKSERLLLSAKKKYFTRLAAIYYSLDRKQENSGEYLKKVCNNANELLRGIMPRLSGKERIVFTLLGASLGDSLVGIVLRPVMMMMYRKRKHG
ncbi:MAG: glycosyltransferase family 2 protein [Defluviitaleaceae bacterium]|nr:glycosyltransferase family 2 protein [Defluviitaleaceae bacterium]